MNNVVIDKVKRMSTIIKVSITGQDGLENSLTREDQKKFLI